VDVNWAKRVDVATGRPVVDSTKLTGASRGNVKEICPTLEGGKSPASPAAYSPRTGLFYLATNNMCMDYQATQATRIAGTPFIGANTPYHAGRGGYMGAFIAWDAAAGKKVWQTTEPYPVWSGAVVTAGDVAFYGTLDGWFKAADARTGKVLWRFKVGSGVAGPRGRPCHATRAAHLRGRRRTAGGRTAGLRESLPGRSAVGGGGRAHVRRDELRRLSRWRGGGLGGPQPARRPLALRRRRRRHLPVDLLRPAARHAGVRRPVATHRHLETRNLPSVARAAGQRADRVVEVAMRLLGGVLGAMLLATVLWDAFETIILPRRVSGRIRLTRLFYRSTWIPWRAAARALSGRKRDVFLSIFGPLSLILLLALWAVGSVFSFGLLQWAAGSAMRVVGDGGAGGGGGAPGFWSDMYMSGTTFFTLGLGDVVPRTALAKTLTVIEAGTGFAFLAAVIGYFPVIYQAFSRREVAISLLDARAGSPPSASELLWRHRGDPGARAL